MGLGVKVIRVGMKLSVGTVMKFWTCWFSSITTGGGVTRPGVTVKAGGKRGDGVMVKAEPWTSGGVMVKAGTEISGTDTVKAAP